MRLLFAPVLLLVAVRPACGQVHVGEIRVRVTDPSGAAVRATVEVSAAAIGFDRTLMSDRRGLVEVREVPFGVYGVRVRQPGFAPYAGALEVHTGLPVSLEVRLGLAPVATQVTVSEAGPLVDPESTSTVSRVGRRAIEERVQALPGRSVQELVASQPGWVFEGSAVLHPRGSEYQTQVVVDGIPLTENRSPGLGPEIEADDVDAVSIYTGGFPAEYGRKMGGVIELVTRRQTDPGTHGEVALSGGSYATAAGYARLQEVVGRNTFEASAAGSGTRHYLNPVVPENFTNRGTTGDFSAGDERQITEQDRLSLAIRHEFSRFLIPNELVQQQAGQVQNGDNLETMGTASYQRILSPESLVTLAGMMRDRENDLASNANPTPIAAFQQNSFREGYFKAAYTLHRGRQEFKAGLESDATVLHENFQYAITDPTQFEDATPPTLHFQARRPDLEQAGFIEDRVRLGGWTLSAGLRWDHYQLLVNEQAFSPRIAVGRAIPKLHMVLHGAYDRVFQTPSFENILISSSPAVETLSPEFLRLPVRPSHGNFFEGGITQSISDRIRVDVNLYRRNMTNYADDDQLLNTGVSYPISFARAAIYGAEAKLEMVQLGRLTGFASYSYMLGRAFFPVTGGLFLGDDVKSAEAQFSGSFPDSQDQRNTASTRWRYQATRRVWTAAGTRFGSGLPFAYQGDPADALAQYGPDVVGRIDFDRGRVKPSLSVNASLGAELWRSEKALVSMQADGDNLNGRLNVIDFGGLFSGNAIGPGRSFGIRLNTRF